MPEESQTTGTSGQDKPPRVRGIRSYFQDSDRPGEVSSSLPARLLALAGIYIPPRGKGKTIIGRRFVRILVLLPFAGLIFLIAFFEYSTSPQFCVSCHIMKPYYDAWKTSRHNKVACVSCHYPPGALSQLQVKFQAMSQVAKYITKTYSSKPYAEIDDASCLRDGCHSERLLDGKVTFKRGIRFDHTPHLTKMRRGKKLRCTSCHSQIVVGNHIEVTEETCFLCHFKGTKHGRTEDPIGGCPLCHTAPEGDFKIGNITYNHRHFVDDLHVPCQKCHLDAIKGEGNATRDKCVTCHNEPWKLKRFDDTTFIHENHVTKRKVECSRCHDPIEHKIQKRSEMVLESDCSLCHTGKHLGQRDLFMGTGGKGSPEIPSHMFLVKVECTACHVSPGSMGEATRFSGQTYTASESACKSCHGGKYKGMVADWKITFDRMLKEISTRERGISALMAGAGSGGPARVKAMGLYQDALFNINLVTSGKGVHNPFYAAELLQVANRNLELAAVSMGKTLAPLDRKGLLQGNYCATLCHQRTGVSAPVTATYKGITFPHRRHATVIAPGCTTCHSPLRHKEIGDTGQTCGACHHKREKPACGRCHSAESALFNGGSLLPGGAKGSPNPHRRVMDCVGCHDLDEKANRYSIVSKCILCHDASYRDRANSFEEEGKRLVATLDDLIRKLELKAEGSGAASQQAKSVAVKLKKDAALVRSTASIHNPGIFKNNVERIIDAARGALKQ